jgi:hypothetical protein
MPLPQFSWCALGFLHYHDRRAWAREAVRRQLPEQVRHQTETALRDAGRYGGLACRWEGYLPELPDWFVHLQGPISYLRHRGTDQRIDFPLAGGPGVVSAENFQLFFTSSRQPDVVQQRLARLFPKGAGLPFALETLTAAGFLEDAGYEYLPPRKFLGLVKHSRAYIEGWHCSADRVWLAADLGDWPACVEAATAAGLPEIVPFAKRRAKGCRHEWLRTLRRAVVKKGLNSDLLRALAAAGAGELDCYIEKALRIAHSSAAAADVTYEDPKWCPTVFEVLREEATRHGRLNPAFVDYLTRHDFRAPEVFDLVRAENSPDWLRLIAIALRPGMGHLLRPTLREALDSRNPFDRIPAAAILALINADWCRADLLRRLNASTDWAATAECRAALREYHDSKLTKAVQRWEAANLPTEPKTGSLDDEAIAHIVRDGMHAAFDRIHPQRHRYAALGEPK